MLTLRKSGPKTSNFPKSPKVEMELIWSKNIGLILSSWIELNLIEKHRVYSQKLDWS